MAKATLISTRAELDLALDGSTTTPVLLLKHSLTCPVSSAAWEAYQGFLAGRSEGDGMLYALVEIQNARDVSAAAADRLGIRHESPQVLLVKEGKCLWNASHWDVTEASLAEALATHGIG